MFPCDQDELNRLDIFHKLITLARGHNGPNGGLYQHTLPQNPQIIDMGCGSGIWGVDMADRCGPHSDILGMDLTLHQPMLIPQGLRFEQRDFEEESGWEDIRVSSRDLIRGQMLLGSVSNWPALYQQVFKHLKPGSGIFEQIEIEFLPLLEEGELPPTSKLGQWARELRGAMVQVGRSIEMNPATKTVLESLGFIDVQHQCKRIPYNTWPSDQHEKLLGRWFNLGMTQGIAALSLAPFTRVNGYSYDEVNRFLAEVKREMCDRQLRAFCHLHIYTARRPPV
ncbi:gliotoxin biosynthesis N-methyltransferase [Microdochium nivale]|nr:gliotoxin biosynthesis N-methyltransferase [Microdochium nivale]